MSLERFFHWNITFTQACKKKLFPVVENHLINGLRIFSHLRAVIGVSRVVDPYGPYGWKKPFSIRTRSENCMSLMGLRMLSHLTAVKGVHGLSIRTVRADGRSRFSIRTRSENCISLIFTSYGSDGGFTGCRI